MANSIPGIADRPRGLLEDSSPCRCLGVDSGLRGSPMDGASNPVSLPLSPPLDPRVRALLTSLGRPRRLDAGEVALHRGRPEPFVQLVASGVLLADAGIEPIRLGRGRRPGRRMPVVVLTAGDVFGESALAELSPTEW